MNGGFAATFLASCVLFASSGCGSESTVPGSGSVRPNESWKTVDPIPCDDPGRSPVDDLLATLGASTASVPDAALRAYGGRIENDPARLAYLADLEKSPWTTACFAGNLAARADASAASKRPRMALIADAASALGVTLEVGGDLPALDTDSPLVGALGRIGGTPSAKERGDIARLPPGFQFEVARLVVAAAEATNLRDTALASLATELPLAQYFDDAVLVWLDWNYTDPNAAPVFDPGVQFQVYRRDGAGASELYEGGARLAQALDDLDVAAMHAADVPPDIDITISTRLGLFVVRGGGDDVYDPAIDPRLEAPALLVVDSGGNDTYRIPAGATTSAEHGVSVNLDLGGDDLYTYASTDSASPVLAPADSSGRYTGSGRGPFSLSTRGRQGSGRLGYGFLIDLGKGRDRYESLRMSQGFAAIGVGLLWDDGGNDTYVAESGAQGAALGGIAILYDGDGDDDYRAFSRAQSFAAVSSASVLFDSAGSDHYELVVDDVVLVGSSQTNGTVNLSLGQGSAMGWRDDKNQNHLGGGVALFRDRGGDDVYVGGTFAQGTGYMMGVGVFADGGGNDSYDAAFYGQGAAAHFAAAAFLEAGGDDRYGWSFAPTQSALGLGHDFSMGVFIEGGGHDRYRAPPWSLGASTCRGVGLALESGGDDDYTPLDAKTLGAAEDVCSDAPTWPTCGLFVDANGNDNYASRGANDKSWSTPAPGGARWFAGGLDEDGSIGAYATLFAR